MYNGLIVQIRQLQHWFKPNGSDQFNPYEILEQAANAIEELQAQLMYSNDAARAIAEKVPKWIPVTERLPECYTWVLVSAEKYEVAFDAFYDGAQWKDAVLNSLIVTHWMPLPEPPKESEA